MNINKINKTIERNFQELDKLVPEIRFGDSSNIIKTIFNKNLFIRKINQYRTGEDVLRKINKRLSSLFLLYDMKSRYTNLSYNDAYKYNLIINHYNNFMRKNFSISSNIKYNPYKSLMKNDFQSKNGIFHQRSY